MFLDSSFRKDRVLLTLQKSRCREEKKHKNRPSEKLSLEVGSLQGVKGFGIFRAEKEINFLVHLKSL